MSSYAPYTYDNAEGGSRFEIPFIYMDEKHLLIYVADELKQLNTHYWIDRDTNEIVFRSPVAAGSAVRIERGTKKSIVFADGSNIRPSQVSSAIEEKSLLLLEQRLNTTGGVLLADQNLSDLTNVSEARTNLDVYSDTQVNTLKDNYLKDSNNLSDLTNIVIARTNLDIYSKGEVTSSIRDRYVIKGDRIVVNQPNDNYRVLQCAISDSAIYPYNGDYVSIGDGVRILSSASIPVGVSSTNKYISLVKDGDYGCSASYETTYPDSQIVGYQGREILGWNLGEDFVPYVGFYGVVNSNININETFDIINGFSKTFTGTSLYLRLPRGTNVTINYSITMNVSGNSSYPYVYITNEITGDQWYDFYTFSNLSPRKSSYTITSTTSDFESVTYNLYEDDWTGSSITKTGTIRFTSTEALESGGTISLSGAVEQEYKKETTLTWKFGGSFLSDTFDTGRRVYLTSQVPSLEVICTKS